MSDGTGVTRDLALLLVLAGLVLPCDLVNCCLVTLVQAITYTLSTLGNIVAKHLFFCGKSTVQYYVHSLL
jgi:hypothetical protein